MSPLPPTDDPPVLVLGYGNELRGDDALGPTAIHALAQLALPDVRLESPHQLTPEWADAIAHARAVLFVDALPATEPRPVTIRDLSPSAPGPAVSHACTPESLLTLARALFGRCPPAALLEIPAVSFELGAPLSAQASAGLTCAVQLARAWISSRPAAQPCGPNLRRAPHRPDRGQETARLGQTRWSGGHRREAR